MKFLDNVDLSANFTSGTIDLVNEEGFSLIGPISGASPAGTFYLQASNDEVNWADVPDAFVTVTGVGDLYFNVANTKYKYARIDFEADVGSAGNVTAYLNIDEQ